MKPLVTLLACLSYCQTISSQSEEVQFKAVLMDNIEGAANGEPARITKTFTSDLNSYSTSKTKEWKIIPRNDPQSKLLETQNKVTIDEAISKINTIVNDLVNQKKVAGFSFGIQRNNRTPKIRYIGFADVDDKKRVNDTHIFPIASLTKLFVSTAILKLSEESKLAIDTTIDSFFPNYPNGKNITIYHLLTNTSGIKAWLYSEMPSDTPENFPNCPSPHKYLEQMNPGKDFEPGEYYNYSNSNFVLLAEIIEITSGKSLQTYLEEIIFTPLELSKSFNAPAPKEQQKVTGYKYETKALTKVKIDAVYGAGSLFSNAKDLLTFMNALNSGKILSDDSFNKMTSYGILSNGEKANTAPYFTSPQLSANWKEYGYGMGIELVKFNNQNMYFHSGLTQGGQAFVTYFPSTRIAFSMVINTQVRFSEELETILLDVSRID